MKKYSVKFKQISKNQQNKMKEVLLKNITFNHISENELDKLENKLNINSKIILSYRNQLLKNIVIKNHYKILNNIEKILNEYKNINILELSKKYEFSPMSIIRLIIKKKYPTLKLSLNNLDKLNSRDKKQVLIAEKNDIVSNLDQGDQQKKAEHYEEKIAHFLDNKGIKYKTQEELIKEQEKEKGFAYATPDFLLIEKIAINDNEVNWIEVKNFYGTNINFMTKKIQKQINKYYKRWGKGCLVYRYAIYENLRLDNCYIISF